ncbi:alpha/beta hydrolase [Maritalea mediterranea]|uniref:Palmitoyl-protein thioesterase ABHD10, mitochondrial n=1 Tax=Maritalea mediterranea TaxID=2909667 RepID=A0ABS9E375_9HYPH|nr:alpha/beta hydrolase [Maritalea mediterranea]MCF4097301.1 alpha/beta hydrolase [Maritalea mediterranea]
MQQPTHWIDHQNHRSKHQLAAIHKPRGGPGLFWLGGFMSNMCGGKAEAVEALGQEMGLATTRFDYAAHGQSSGDFRDQTISGWLSDAIAVYERFAHGPQILIGSSMGAWLALLLNRYLLEQGHPPAKALVLIAPGVDFTKRLLPQRFAPDELAKLASEGELLRESRYGDGPYIYTKDLVEDGNAHALLDTPLKTGAPVHIIHGGQDPDVPLAHAQETYRHFLHDEARFTLVPDGDHRLSRPQDLALMQKIIRSFASE